jgi:hypothetical protein
MEFDFEFVQKMMEDSSLDFRFVNEKDTLFHTGELACEEAKGNVARILEKTPMALEIVLTTAGNYKLYNSNGTMLKFLDKKYHTLTEIIFWIKRI